jgi:hypothetical protein
LTGLCRPAPQFFGAFDFAITLTFTPIGGGTRSANLTITQSF